MFTVVAVGSPFGVKKFRPSITKNTKSLERLNIIYCNKKQNGTGKYRDASHIYAISIHLQLLILILKS